MRTVYCPRCRETYRVADVRAQDWAREHRENNTHHSREVCFWTVRTVRGSWDDRQDIFWSRRFGDE